LKTGDLWMDEDNWNIDTNDIEKRKFIEFVNKLLSWESWEPVKVGESGNITLDQMVLERFVRELWIMPYEKIMKNLQVVNITDNMWTKE
jgi:hypothetical protein